MKISVIGIGNVGAMVGFTLARSGLADEIVLCGRDSASSQQKTAAEAMDMTHAVAFTTHRMTIRSGTLEDAKESDIIVIAASIPMPEGMQDRMDLARGNTKLMQELIPMLAEGSPNAIFINATNPVDVITYHMIQLSGFDWRRVIGTGTLIDSARFRKRLADEMDINAVDINTYIIGEHGKTQFATISNASAGNMKLDQVADISHCGKNMLKEVEEEIQDIAYAIFNARGYTNYAIAMAVEMIVENIVKDTCNTLPVSSLIQGFCDERNVCLSLPCAVGRRGIRCQLQPELNEEEQGRFKKSAKAVRECIEQSQDR